jgi:NADH-quinone oxidoreductase subunit K
MDELALLEKNLFVGALLFGIGLVGFFSRRNMIVMFLSVEMMLQGVSVSLVAWGRYHNDWGGQMLVIFILRSADGRAQRNRTRVAEAHPGGHRTRGRPG